jgi:hypothetical protein
VIFPRTRSARRRYQRHKIIAIAVTFALGWIAWKVLPGNVLPARWKPFPPATPESAFRDRASGVTVETGAVVEAALPDSTDPVSAVRLRRWRLRSVAGHPFVLIAGPEDFPSPFPGDTLQVRGTYRWDNTGGTVRVGETLPAAPSGPADAS